MEEELLIPKVIGPKQLNIQGGRDQLFSENELGEFEPQKLVEEKEIPEQILLKAATHV